MSAMERPVRALLALAAWAGLGIQLWLLLTSPAFASPAEAVWRFVAFFTILTNLIVAVSATVLTLRPDHPALGPAPRAAIVLYILTVGIVYHLLLAGLWAPEGWQWVADQLLHTVTPVMTLIVWLAFDPKAGLSLKALPGMLAWPLVYSLYALARGAADGFYPYPFLDAGGIGYVRALINIAGLTAAFLAGGALLILIGRALAHKGPENYLAVAGAPDPKAGTTNSDSP